MRVCVRECDGVLYFSTIILLYQFSLPLSIDPWEGVLHNTAGRMQLL